MPVTRSVFPDVYDKTIAAYVLESREVMSGEYSSMMADRFSWNQVAPNTSTYIETADFMGVGPTSKVEELEPVDFSTFYQGYNKRSVPSDFGQGLRISHRLMRDDMQNIVNRGLQTQSQAPIRTECRELSKLWNNAFNSTYYTGPDGKPICATDHPINPSSPVELSNKLAVPSYITHSALEAGFSQLMQQPDGYGDPRETLRPGDTVELHVTSADAINAMKIVKAVLEPVLNNQAIPNSAMQMFNVVAKPNPWLYQIGTTRPWFLLPSTPERVREQGMSRKGIMLVEKEAVSTDSYYDKPTRSYISLIFHSFVIHVQTSLNVFGSGDL